jgi:hypothetical protein
MNTYILQEPNRELTEGYFTALMKYAVVFLIAWMFGQLIIFTYPCVVWTGEKYPPTLAWLNDYHIISWILVLIGSYFYVMTQIKKYALPMITKFRFDNTHQQLELELLHTFTGKTSEINISFNTLTITFETKENMWYGKQRIYHFNIKGKSLALLNIEKTAWKQFPEIDSLVEQLNKHLL